MPRFPLLLASAVLSAFVIPAFAADAANRADNTPTVSAINDRMEGFVADGALSGAVTLVAHEGEVIHHSAVGLANIEESRCCRRSGRSDWRSARATTRTPAST
jgi:hypothetical protein